MDSHFREEVLLDDISKSATRQSTLFESIQIIDQALQDYMIKLDRERRRGHGG